MQFHLNGFEPGDPGNLRSGGAISGLWAQGSVPEEVDVLIVGCGPAGLTLAAQLSAFPDIKTCIVEQKSGRMLLGRPTASRAARWKCSMPSASVERVLKEACWINETTFWKPDDKQPANDRPQRLGPGRGRRAVGIPARRSESGARARLLSRCHAEIRRQTGAVLCAARRRRLSRRRRRATRSNACTVTLERLDPAHEGQTRDGQGPLRGRLRRRAQHRPHLNRARTSRQFRKPRLGRDGCAGRHRLPGHSLQVPDPVRP